jgi:aryl-alcohol dehydrogenase (NADP+)
MFGQRSFDPGEERDVTPITEQLEVFADLIRAGKIRYLGLSNETPWGIAQFMQVAESHDLPRPVSIQNAYNLLNRSFENGLDEACFHTGVGLLAYSPLAFGLLSGKYRRPAGSGRMTLFPGFGQRYDKPNVKQAVADYAALAEAHDLSPAQMALAFVRSRWFTSSTIISATTLQQLAEDIDSHSLSLTEELLTEIEAIHARYPNPAP